MVELRSLLYDWMLYFYYYYYYYLFLYFVLPTCDCKSRAANTI